MSGTIWANTDTRLLEHMLSHPPQTMPAAERDWLRVTVQTELIHRGQFRGQFRRRVK